MYFHRAEPLTIWFTADQHFGHANIIQHVQRPFRDVREMNLTLRNKWNALVGKQDVVYHLGDIAWGKPQRKLLDELHGTIHLVLGNHDRALKGNTYKDRFASMSPLLEVELPDSDAKGGKQLVVLCHYAMRTWNKSHYGSWHLYGHSHGSLSENLAALSFDVGVDCWKFAPVSYEQVKAKMKTKTVK